MADEPTSEQAPRDPYRKAEPLAAIIPPDRRRRNAILLSLASFVAGMAALRFGEEALALWQVTHPPEVARGPTPREHGPNARVGQMVLRGPGGNVVALPQSSPMIVNVWLQGCPDCMPAFEAYRAVHTSGGFGVDAPVVNVAYSNATVEWAKQYGVEQNLVLDPDGAALVNPLGIGTFTTLVIDRRGDVVLTDRPDRIGYAARVSDAVRRIDAAARR